VSPALHFRAKDIIDVQDRTDLHDHGSTVTVEPGKLKANDVLTLPDLQLGQVVAEAREEIVELGHLGNGFDSVAGGDQSSGHHLARPADTCGIIGEDVDVLSGTVDDSMGD
jgi:hypothetical protein